MIKYYNWCHTSILVFQPGDKLFLDISDIYTTQLSAKLLYYYLGSYIVEKWVGLMLYCLKLSLALQRLYLVFYIIKLMSGLEDPIFERYSKSSLNPIIIDGEEE